MIDNTKMETKEKRIPPIPAPLAVAPLREWEEQFYQIAAEQACGLTNSIINKEMHDMFYEWNGSHTNVLCPMCSGYQPGVLGNQSMTDCMEEEDFIGWCECPEIIVDQTTHPPTRFYAVSSGFIPIKMFEISGIDIIGNQTFIVLNPFRSGVQEEAFLKIIKKARPDCMIFWRNMYIHVKTTQLPQLVEWFCPNRINLDRCLEKAIVSVMRLVLPKDCVTHLMPFVPFWF